MLSTFRKLFKFPKHLKLLEHPSSEFWYRARQFLKALVMDFVWTYQVSYWPFLDCKCRKFHSSLMYDREVHLPFYKQSKCEKPWRINYICYKFNLSILCVFLLQRKFRLCLTVHNHPVDIPWSRQLSWSVGNIKCRWMSEVQEIAWNLHQYWRWSSKQCCRHVSKCIEEANFSSLQCRHLLNGESMIIIASPSIARKSKFYMLSGSFLFEIKISEACNSQYVAELYLLSKFWLFKALIWRDLCIRSAWCGHLYFYCNYCTTVDIQACSPPKYNVVPFVTNDSAEGFRYLTMSYMLLVIQVKVEGNMHLQRYKKYITLSLVVNSQGYYDVDFKLRLLRSGKMASW